MVILKQYFIPCLATIMVAIYMIEKIINVRHIKMDLKNTLVILIMCALSILNFMYIDNYIRFFISTLYTIVCSKIIFNVKFSKIVMPVILEQILLFLSELIYMLILILILYPNNALNFEYIQGSYLTTLVICALSIVLISIKPIYNLILSIVSYTEKINQQNKYIIALILIITLNFLLLIIYISSQNIIMVIINVVLIVVYSFIMYLLLNEKYQNIKYKEENQVLIQNLNEYEKMLDYQRISNHENKNQLLVIKSIASKNNKKLHEYIDEIINYKREDDENLYTMTKRIPSGGLQGLIYQKLLLMQDKNIVFDLNVSRDVRKIDLYNLDSKTNYDICRSIGIILDNAIEEVINNGKPELAISMYKDDYFIIEIANKCNEMPDFSKIDNKGFTTKKGGHGYGLALLKEICNYNPKIINERKIIDDIFIQIIKIKI